MINTIIDLSKITLGTVQFGLNYGINNSKGKISESETEDILKYAINNNIESLDTASVYGNSESIIGLFRKKSELFRSYKITTKFKFENGKSIKEHIFRAQENLNIKKIDIVLFHSFQDYVKFDLKEKPSEIDKIGVSLYTNEEIKHVINDPIIKCIQVPFNLLDNEYLRGDILRKAKDRGIEVQVRSVFLQGLFFMDLKDLPISLVKLKSHLKELHKLAFDNSLSISQIALGYVLSKSYIDKVLIGIDSIDQLKSNIYASKIKLDSSVIKKIDSIMTINKNLLNPTNW